MAGARFAGFRGWIKIPSAALELSSLHSRSFMLEICDSFPLELAAVPSFVCAVMSESVHVNLWLQSARFSGMQGCLFQVRAARCVEVDMGRDGGKGSERTHLK